MRILTVSDKVEPVLYGPFIRDRVGRVDLIVSCGDLPYDYLDYIASMLDAPLHFVHGNHDIRVTTSAHEDLSGMPAGITWAVNLHGRMRRHDGLLLAGLEGSRVYVPGSPFQYSEGQARWIALKMIPGLLLNKLRYGRYLDVFVTHAPPWGIHDGNDVAHRGFKVYLSLLRRFRPLLMVHGHRHVYDRNSVTETMYARTCVVNTYGYRLFDLKRRPDGNWQLLDNCR